MRHTVLSFIVLMVAASANAELRHVEIKTLGMD
jgi:hypothetical protein